MFRNFFLCNVERYLTIFTVSLNNTLVNLYCSKISIDLGLNEINQYFLKIIFHMLGYFTEKKKLSFDNLYSFWLKCDWIAKCMIQIMSIKNMNKEGKSLINYFYWPGPDRDLSINFLLAKQSHHLLGLPSSVANTWKKIKTIIPQ